MNAITPFQFDTTAVRAIERDGQAWFVAADVCAALKLTNPSMAIAPLDPEERAKFFLGRQGEATIISESGLYTLVLRTRDALIPGTAAHRFRKWVTGEVLPALRRTGSYGGGDAAAVALNDPAALRGLLLGYSERVLALEDRNTALAGENAALTPKAEALDRISRSEGSMNITAAAKALAIGPKALHSWLRDHGWTYRRPPDGRVFGFQTKIDAGFLEQKLVTVAGDRGSPDRSYWQVLVTPKGLARLASLLNAQVAA